MFKLKFLEYWVLFRNIKLIKVAKFDDKYTIRKGWFFYKYADLFRLNCGLDCHYTDWVDFVDLGKASVANFQKACGYFDAKYSSPLVEEVRYERIYVKKDDKKGLQK